MTPGMRGAPATARRARTTFVVRVLVSIGLLGILWIRLPELDASKLIPRWSLGNCLLLAAGLGMFLVSYGFGAARWQKMLHLLGIRAERRRVLRHALAGQFVSVVLPGSVGGDVLRARRLANEVGDGSGIAASVALERLTGFAVLPLFTVVGLAINDRLREHGGRTSSIALTVALVTWGVLGLLMVAGGHRSLGRRFGASTRGWRRMLGTLHLGVIRFRTRPRQGLEVMLAGLLQSVMQLGAAYIAARVLGIHQVGATVLLVFFPAVGILQVLPIAVGGLGVREWSLALFLNPLGVPTERAVALGLLFYALTVATSLAGAPAFALGTRQARRPPPARSEVPA